MFVDIPSKEVLPELEKLVIEKFKDIVLPGMDKIELEKLEWTTEGLRLWIKT